MRRIVALLLAGTLLIVLGLNCKDAPKDEKEGEGDTVIQETLHPKDTTQDTAEAEPVGGGATDASKMKEISPLPDTIDKPEGKGHGGT